MTGRASRWTAAGGALCAAAVLVCSCGGGAGPPSANAPRTTTAPTTPPSTTVPPPTRAADRGAGLHRSLLAHRGLHAGPAGARRPTSLHHHRAVRLPTHASHRPAPRGQARWAGSPRHQGPVLHQFHLHAVGHPGRHDRAGCQVRPLRQRGVGVYAVERTGGPVHLRGTGAGPGPCARSPADLHPGRQSDPDHQSGLHGIEQTGHRPGEVLRVPEPERGRPGAATSDVVEIQGQQAEDEPGFTSFVSQAAAQARAAAPTHLVLLGITTSIPGSGPVSPATLSSVVASTRPLVDGYWLNIPGQSSQCPGCGQADASPAVSFLEAYAAGART